MTKIIFLRYKYMIWISACLTGTCINIMFYMLFHRSALCTSGNLTFWTDTILYTHSSMNVNLLLLIWHLKFLSNFDTPICLYMLIILSWKVTYFITIWKYFHRRVINSYQYNNAQIEQNFWENSHDTVIQWILLNL